MTAPGSGAIAVRRALLATADTRGLFDLAVALDARGVALVATHATWIALASEGLVTTALAPGRPPLDGLVELLAPEVHAAVGARGQPDDLAAPEDAPEDGDGDGEAGLEPFELVVCNPRRVAGTSGRPDATLAMATGDIDAGGVALIRAAARNHARVAVVVDPDDYPALLAELEVLDGAIGAVTRLRLAARAFAATAAHDAAVASYLAAVPDDVADARDDVARPVRLGGLVTGPWRRSPLALASDDIALYLDPPSPLGIGDGERATIAGARLVHGAPLPATVIRDLDRALALVGELRGPHAAVVVRDDEPVTAADDDDLLLDGAAFPVHGQAERIDGLAGAALAYAGELTARMGARLARSGLAAIVVPALADDVLATWPSDEPRVLIAPGAWRDDPAASLALAPLAWRSVAGGLLVQEADAAPIEGRMAALVTATAPTAAQLASLELAARVARHVRAHALVVVQRLVTIAIVGGQPDLSRAIVAARAQLAQAVDAVDGVEVADRVAAVSARIDDPADLDALAAAGVRALWQPGGSARDAEVMAAADRHGLAMVLSGVERVRR